MLLDLVCQEIPVKHVLLTLTLLEKKPFNVQLVLTVRPVTPLMENVKLVLQADLSVVANV